MSRSTIRYVLRKNRTERSARKSGRAREDLYPVPVMKGKTRGECPL